MLQVLEFEGFLFAQVISRERVALEYKTPNEAKQGLFTRRTTAPMIASCPPDWRRMGACALRRARALFHADRSHSPRNLKGVKSARFIPAYKVLAPADKNARKALW